MKKILQPLRSCRLYAAHAAPNVLRTGGFPNLDLSGAYVMRVTKSIVPKDLSRVISGATIVFSRKLRAVMGRLPFAQYEGYVGAYAEYYRDEYTTGRRERTSGKRARRSA
jgi:hypothetical protein